MPDGGHDYPVEQVAGEDDFLVGNDRGFVAARQCNAKSSLMQAYATARSCPVAAGKAALVNKPFISG